MERGFVPLWRCAEDDPVFSDPKLWHLWSLLLMRATYRAKEALVMMGGKKTIVHLEPGQVVFGRKAWAKKLGQSESATYRALEWLKKLQMVSIQTNNRFSVVSLMNWQRYNVQGMDTEQPTERPSGQQADSKRTAGGQQADTSKKVLEVEDTKPLERARKRRTPPESSTEHTYFVRWWTWAYEETQGKSYVFVGGKDGKIVKTLLGSPGIVCSLRRATQFLLSSDPWLNGKRDLGIFLSRINTFEDVIPEGAREYIAPPEGMNWDEWRPWENPPEEEGTREVC
jgi:hypothetical protein